MNRVLSLTAVIAISLGTTTPDVAFSQEGNWKRGRVYYRMVCTACHKEVADQPIAPNSRTIAEWTTYMEADQHNIAAQDEAASQAAESTVSHYTSQAYRASIKDQNKAAKKFLKLENEALFADVFAFVVHGAKDSDTPATCQ